MVQKLQFEDYQKRREFTYAFLRLTNDETFLSHLIMSDEARFHIGGYVNEQNYRFWVAEHPMNIHEQPAHAHKVTVWCGITNERIIGPYFLEDDNGLTLTVTGHKCRKIIEEYILLSKLHDLDIQNFWFKQDGTTAHTAWGNHDITEDSLTWWFNFSLWRCPMPPRSPDFILCGCLKGKVYSKRPNNIH